jgi:hypothetical protein
MRGEKAPAVTPLAWIIASGLLMSAIALVGSVTLFLSEATLKKILLPLVALAAGTLLGGALLHMIPPPLKRAATTCPIYLWTLTRLHTFSGARTVPPLASLPPGAERAPAFDVLNLDRRRGA